MRREIKFRCWTDNLKDGGEMYYGYLNEYGSILFSPAGYGLCNPSIEVMQFTGLLDKNGKEIYEGDLLEVDWKDARYPVHTIGPVEWNVRHAQFVLGEGGTPQDDARDYMQVIGNIYSTPDLITS